MGSKTTTSGRKQKDNPIIKVPRSFESIAGANGLPEQASDNCPPSFQERIEESPIVQVGIKVSLNKTGDRYAIMIQGETIGVLSKRNCNKISECLNLNVRYSGKIVKIKDEYYARFFRETD